MMRIFWIVFATAFTGAVAPGPMLAIVIGQALAQGAGAALAIVAGHAVLEAAIVIALMRGAGSVLKRRKVRTAMGLIGGAVMIWMGIDILLHAGRAALATDSGSALSLWGLIAAGMAVSVSNPYFSGWWATVGAAQISALNVKTRAQAVVFFAAHELGDVVWFLFVALCVVAGKRWFGDQAYRALLVFCGGVIVVLGVVFVWLGLHLKRQEKKDKDSPGLE